MTAPSRVRIEPIRALRLTWLFLRIGVMNELQYRVNFFIQLFQSMLSFGTALAVLALVFSHTTELRGWSPYELLVVMGVHTIMGGLIRTGIQPNMELLIEDIRQGTFDHALTKPQDAQLLASIRQVRVWQAMDVLVGSGILTVAVINLESSVELADALTFALAILIGGTMIYCFWLIITVGAFWVVRMEFIVEMFEGVYQAGRWPVGIYPVGMRALLTFLVPLAFAVTVPAESLTGRLDAQTLGLAAAFALSLMAFTRWWWKFGLRHYSGASA